MSINTALQDKFDKVNMFKTCEQCGLCSSACPITGKSGFNVRRILKHVELDLESELANTPWAWLCTTCGRCETVCPNGIAVLDIMRPLRAQTKAECSPPPGPPPCVRACPGGIDIPGYLRLVAQGKPQEAYELILERVCLPGVLGRVCTHPCESQCRRGDVNQPVSICALKRYAADHAQTPPAIKPAADTGHKVAVVGSGPAGLAAAYFLRKKGHQVTIFEARAKAGGMLRYGIPAYRLPEEVLDREIKVLLDMGVAIETGKALGKNFDFDALKAQGFESVFVALGLQTSRRIPLDGSDHADVLWGLDFLTSVREGQDIALKNKVLVIGGGNVAVDVALTALRQGASQVTMACLEKLEEMPANSWDIAMAQEEGVALLNSWGPQKVVADSGQLKGLEMVRCTSVFNDQCVFSPEFDADEQNFVEADQIILAIGQAADLACLGAGDACSVKSGLIVADPETQATSLAGVYAGGDASHGPKTVIEAIASGKRAASAIDKELGGDGVVEPQDYTSADGVEYDGTREKGFADISRTALPSLSLGERRANKYAEVELCYPEEIALREAYRCLQCDLEKKLVMAMK